MERHLVFFQELDAAHHFIVRSFAGAIFAMLVVNVRGTVDADAYAAVVLEEKFAPGIVDESAVGLKIMDDLTFGNTPGRHQSKRFLVISKRNRKRLACMPHYA